MGKRRFAQVSSSDDEGEEAKPEAVESLEEGEFRPPELEEVEESEGAEQEQSDGEEDEQGSQRGDAKPVGEVIKVAGKGRDRKEYYAAFEFDGNRYELEDSVLLTPTEIEFEKPGIAIIKM